MLRHHPSMDRANLDLRPKSHAISPLPGRARCVIRPLPMLMSTVYVLREEKGWNNTHLHTLIVKVLNHSMDRYKTEFQLVLFMDGVAFHLSEPVLFGDLQNEDLWVSF